MANSEEDRSGRGTGGSKAAGGPLPFSLSSPAVFPSGRQLVLKVGKRGEELELRSATGEIELSVELTERGPVVRLRGAQLVIDSTESVKIQCRTLEIDTREELRIKTGSDLSIHSQRELQLKSAKQTFIDGDYVNLNCLDRTGYHDEGVEYPSYPEGISDESGAAPADPSS